jgi:peptidoglycan/LPS O-acetylase OafA/YrhL
VALRFAIWRSASKLQTKGQALNTRLFFPAIDGLRAFAALSVLVYHVIAMWKWESFPKQWPMVWFYAGGLGVDLFFVISGFVIGLAAFGALDDDEVKDFRANFARRRLARIVPLHYLTLLVFVIVIAPGLLTQPDFAGNLATHLLFLHNLWPSYHGAIDGPNWSLAIEMQFYALMLLMGPWLARLQPWKFVAAATIIAWTWRGAVFGIVPADRLGSFQTFFASTQLPGVLDEFAVGLCLARFVRTAQGQGTVAYLASSGTRWAMPAAIGGAALLFFGTMVLFFANGSFYWNSPQMVIGFRTLLAAMFGVLVLVASAISLHQWGEWLGPINYLGKISYGIYLWHLPVLLALQRFLPDISPFHVLQIAVPATLLLSSVSWHLFEQPLLRRLGRTPEPRAKQMLSARG